MQSPSRMVCCMNEELSQYLCIWGRSNWSVDIFACSNGRFCLQYISSLVLSVYVEFVYREMYIFLMWLYQYMCPIAQKGCVVFFHPRRAGGSKNLVHAVS